MIWVLLCAYFGIGLGLWRGIVFLVPQSGPNPISEALLLLLMWPLYIPFVIVWVILESPSQLTSSTSLSVLSSPLTPLSKPESGGGITVGEDHTSSERRK